MKAIGGRVSRVSASAATDPLLLIEPKALVSIVAAAADLTLMVARDGVIKSVLVNEATGDFGKLDHWVGRSIRAFLTAESVPKLENVLERIARGEAPPRAVELNHRDNAVWDFPIQYNFHDLESEGAVLMIGRDLRAVAETQRQLVQAQIALERGYEAQRDYDSRYRMLLAHVTDAMTIVSLSTGRVVDLNDSAAAMLGGARQDLLGRVFASLLDEGTPAEIEARLLAAAVADSEAPVRLRSRDVAIAAYPSVFRAGGDRLALCRLEAEGDAPAARDGFGDLLRLFYTSAVDALVVTDLSGRIEAANDPFLSMVDAPDLAALRGRSLGEFLSRGQVDLNVVLDNVRRNGRVRLYASEVTGDFGARSAVELSACALGAGGDARIGLILRDASRADVLRRPVAEGEVNANENILELVGHASLKEIVAETSDVIEKMCIETAIRLTNNNRVAAAEMLGLSRQSLYVKLRKYDLLKRGDDDEARS